MEAWALSYLTARGYFASIDAGRELIKRAVDLPRDPERIDRVLALIGHAGHETPDYRLGQLLSNLLHTREGRFGVEDRRLEETLIEFRDKTSGD